jgi:hypothetical protein
LDALILENIHGFLERFNGNKNILLWLFVESVTGFYGDHVDRILNHIPNRLSFKDNLSRPQLGIVLSNTMKRGYAEKFRNALANETISWHKDTGTANPVLSVKNLKTRVRSQLMAFQTVNESGKMSGKNNGEQDDGVIVEMMSEYWPKKVLEEERFREHRRLLDESKKEMIRRKHAEFYSI